MWLMCDDGEPCLGKEPLQILPVGRVLKLLPQQFYFERLPPGRAECLLPLRIDGRRPLLELLGRKIERVVLHIEQTVRAQDRMDRSQDGGLLGIRDMMQGVLRNDGICDPRDQDKMTEIRL